MAAQDYVRDPDPLCRVLALARNPAVALAEIAGAPGPSRQASVVAVQKHTDRDSYWTYDHISEVRASSAYL